MQRNIVEYGAYFSCTKIIEHRRSYLYIDQLQVKHMGVTDTTLRNKRKINETRSKILERFVIGIPNFISRYVNIIYFLKLSI